MKRQFQKTTGLKDPPVYNLRSRVLKTEGSKDPSAYNSSNKLQKTETPKDPPAYNSSKVHKTEVSKDSLVATRNKEIQKNKGPKASTVAARRNPKTDGPKDSLVIQKRITPIATIQNTVAPVEKTVTTKTSAPAVVANDKKKKPCYMYYIKQDEFAGDDMEFEPSGHICIICHKDLFDVPQDDDDDGSHEDDEYDDDEYEYDMVSRHLLPAADVLPCGHAFHTECFKDHALKTQSGDPRCILCLQL